MKIPTPLQKIIQNNIINKLLINEIYKESFEKTIEDLQNINSKLNPNYNLYNGLYVTIFVFIISAYFKFNNNNKFNIEKIYNKQKYKLYFKKNIKVIILIITFIFIKNIESVQ
jgi:hypothetical protein